MWFHLNFHPRVRIVRLQIANWEHSLVLVLSTVCFDFEKIVWTYASTVLPDLSCFCVTVWKSSSNLMGVPGEWAGGPRNICEWCWLFMVNLPVWLTTTLHPSHVAELIINGVFFYYEFVLVLYWCEHFSFPSLFLLFGIFVVVLKIHLWTHFQLFGNVFRASVYCVKCKHLSSSGKQTRTHVTTLRVRTPSFEQWHVRCGGAR